MYSSLSQFKAYLWIDSADTTKDSQLTLALNSACELLNHLCGVDSFDQWEYEEQIDLRKVYTNSFWYNIFLKNKPVQSISKINGSDYSWVRWTDYMVANQRRIIFKSLDVNSDFGFITVNYTAWYNRNNEWADELPDDLKLMEMILACWKLSDELKSELNIWVSSYKLWDEQIVYGWKTTDQTVDEIYFSFKIMLDKFKNFTLAI